MAAWLTILLWLVGKMARKPDLVLWRRGRIVRPVTRDSVLHAHKRRRPLPSNHGDNGTTVPLGRPARKPNHDHDDNGKPPQWYRVYDVQVHPDKLKWQPPTKPSTHAATDAAADASMDAVWQALGRRWKTLTGIPLEDCLHCPSPNATTTTPSHGIRVVRRSLDARRTTRRQDGGTGPRFVFVLDVRVTSPPRGRGWKEQPGKLECMAMDDPNEDSTSTTTVPAAPPIPPSETSPAKRVLIVGSGPCGIFCALRLLQHSSSPRIIPIVLERGQPVEVRGRDIGALTARKALTAESNYAFGEGGAGTWSDGKLTTRIGRNSRQVRQVLETLVEYGAPSWILQSGAPHLGTDNLVRLLRNMRFDLRAKGGEIYFGTKVTDFVWQDGVLKGVQYEHTPAQERSATTTTATTSTGPPPLDANGTLWADAVVLATGHSARDVYQVLHQQGVPLQAKGFAVGFRVEHPQKLINQIQYGHEWGLSVVTGKQTTDRENEAYQRAVNEDDDNASNSNGGNKQHTGQLPVASYRLATNKAYDGTSYRGAYSFCMCPGGQIVLASTDPKEICVNGMSFSRRDSRWANSALVVTINPDDPILEPYRKEHGVLAGIAFQRAMERKAADLGGGNLCVPVQSLTDFMARVPSTSVPSSSYRLGVKPAACHEIYPPAITTALRDALTYFDKVMPGYLCSEGLLHAVETRTSSPVRVCRNDTTLEAEGVRGLFPAGEGAGFAGGIVSAAVDGMVVAEAVIDSLVDTTAARNPSTRRSASASKTAGNFY